MSRQSPLDLNLELRKTNPDFVVYVPASADGSTGDTGNEHFLVFDGPDRSLMAVWTQSTFEGKPDQRIVVSKSIDAGQTWRPPRVIAGPDPEKGVSMASWGFPMVSRSGRIYVLYNRHTGRNDIFTHTTGLMAGVWSDDAGETWSQEQVVPMPKSLWDNPDPAMPANWIVWQKPLRLSQGKYFAGFTRWVSPAVRPPTPINVWWAHASVVEFMRFENLDDDPEVRRLAVSWFARGRDALQVGLIGHPGVSVVQEPSIVKLPDGRLFCVMRTTTGHPYCTVSEDEGVSWRKPESLARFDGGAPFLHPCSPCPIYRAAEGEYVFFLHNHDGHFDGWTPKDTTRHRRPVCLARGLHRPGAVQPVWVSEPVFFMDHGGVPILRADLAMYASVTYDAEGMILWYPDRKFFLLGRRIPREMLDAIDVPLN